MKKFAALLLAVVMVSVCSSLIAPAAAKAQVVTAVSAEEISTDVNAARFLNMLNHNYVYNTAFDNADEVVNNSVLALLHLRDTENEDFINETYVRGFIKDMYGIDIVDMSALNAEFPQMDGYVYIIPRGFTSYNHEIVSVSENEDGSFTVITDVTIGVHDADAKTERAVSLFVENEQSAFGYSLIYSNIIENGTDI